MEASNPAQAAREELMGSLSSCAQRNQLVSTRQAAFEAMKKSFQMEAAGSLKRRKQELLAQKNALNRAKRRFRDGQRTVFTRLVELSKVELRVITEKVKQELPTEVCQMIFEMCWDDDSLFWAQEILRFSQILDSNGDKYRTYRQLQWADEVFEGALRDGFTPHVRQLSTKDYEVLFANEFMDGYGLPILGTWNTDSHSIIRCLGQYLTSPQVVGHATAQEFLHAFYRADLRCNFYVEMSHLKHFLEYDPFELGVQPSAWLTNMMVPLNDFENITSLNLAFDQQPLLNLRMKGCFSLKFLVYEQDGRFSLRGDDLQAVKSLAEELKKTLKSVSCICIPVCECCGTPNIDGSWYAF